MPDVLHYLLQHPELFIGWTVSLVVAIIAFIGIVISSDFPHKWHQRRQERKLRNEEKNKRKAKREFTRVCSGDIACVRTFFRYICYVCLAPAALENLYVPLRVQPGNALRALLDARLRQVEEMRDPEVYLQTELDLLEDYVSRAIDPVDALRTYKHMVIVRGPWLRQNHSLALSGFTISSPPTDRLTISPSIH